MKKRSFLMTVLAMVLVAVISVGATFAYLTAQDKEVVNTFKFANDMTVTLTEPVPTPTKDEKITEKTGDEKGMTYENVVPGQTLGKAPTISTNTSVDAYVFVKISGASEKVWPTAINSDWTKLEADTHNNGVWYRTVEGKVGADGKAELQDLGAIFETVTVGAADLTNKSTDINLGDIKIQVYEIQQVGFNTAADAFAETNLVPALPVAGA